MSSSRQLLQVVGMAAGSFFGPVGAAVGGIIGGEVGGFIDGPPEGPRLSDLTAPQIEYGGKIGRFYGGPKWFEVSPLYMSEKRESSTVVGGKGGDSGVEQFSYSCDMLLRVCESREGTPCEVIAVTGVEVDGELVWTALADASAEAIANSAEQEIWSAMDVMLGAETQAPWSVYEAAVGTDNANAYRGYLTVGFSDFQLAQNGQPRRVRIQAITAGTSESDGSVILLILGDQADGTTGGNLLDTSSYAHEITGSGGAAAETTGAWSGSGSIYSDGVAGSQVTTDSAQASLAFGTGDFCIEVANNPDAQPNRFPVLYSYSGGGFNLEIQYDNEDYPGEYVLFKYTGGGTFLETIHGGSTPAGWGMVSINRSAGVTQFFVDGSPIGSFIDNDDYGSVGLHWLMGRAGVSSETHFAGLAELRVTRRSRYTSAHTPPTSFTDDGGELWTPATVPLRDILEYEAERCTPLTSANIDFSAADGLEVECHVAIGTAAEAMQPLLTRFWFDLYSADKLYLVRRGGSVEQTIAHKWTGAGQGGRSESFAGLIRANDVEVAKKKAITYADVLKDGEADTRTGDRESVGTAVDTLTLNLNMRPSEAQGLADTATWDARIGAHTATVRLGARHGLLLQPGSVITLTDHQGNTYRCLVLRLVWNRWVWECEVRLDDPTVLSSAGIAVDLDQRALTVAAPPEATLYVLDIPLLRPQDDGPGEYVLVTQTGRFRGVDILKSSDDVSYSIVGEVQQRGTAGVCDSVLGAFSRWGWDNSSVLTVTLDDGSGDTLSSATKAAIEANRYLNLAAVGVHGRWELIQFSTATLTTGTTYELRGILRNCFGTEWTNADHDADDKFALLTANGMARIAGSVADLGQTRYFKAVPRGRSRDNVAPVSIVCEQQALLPYAPVDVRNDAGTLRWNRRSRLEGAIGIEPPIGEVSERYDAETYSGVTLDDSESGLTAPEWAPSTAAGRTARVYQLSDLVGRGHVAEKAIP
jgi:hypothetical protein